MNEIRKQGNRNLMRERLLRRKKMMALPREITQKWICGERKDELQFGHAEPDIQASKGSPLLTPAL